MGIRKVTSNLIAATLGGDAAKDGEHAAEKLWQATYELRQKYFEDTIGPLPNDILKMLNMTGVWPGGGLYAIPAPNIGPNISVYTTFGLTNSDMPTTVQIGNFNLESDVGKATHAGGTLSKRVPAPKLPGAAGYGYEILVVAQSNQQWPLNFLQWAVNAEIIHDAGLLTRVEGNDGLTVEQIEVGQAQTIHVLIAQALPPLPVGTQLPDGRMDVLTATTITDQEMQWSQINGRGALLKLLQESGPGQMSVLGRQSIVQ